MHASVAAPERTAGLVLLMLWQRSRWVRGVLPFLSPDSTERFRLLRLAARRAILLNDVGITIEKAQVFVGAWEGKIIVYGSSFEFRCQK